MAQAPKVKSQEEWAKLRFEAGRIFTPSTPIGIADLFAGRLPQIRRVIDTVAERGRHVIVYGEPGVGKTSLAQVIQHVIPYEPGKIRYIRKSAFSSDTYSSIWMSVFKDIHVWADLGEGEKKYSIAEFYKDGVTPGDVVRELSVFAESDVPIIVIDEYNLVKDKDSSRQMAETIKAVSDDGLNVTIVIVGISDTVENLINGHGSIERCSEEVLMPRMDSHEMQVLIESRVSKLGMKIAGDAKWKIINLSKGLPSFGHALGRGAVLSAIDTRKMQIAESNVNYAIDDWIGGSQNTLKSDYEAAVRSNQERARFRQILTACALAQTDESGYFTAKQVQQPLASILKKTVGIDGFNPNLKELSSSKRGNVLQQIGSERIYRYRFSNPAMQPYVIMKGIQDGLLDEKATSALSSPEQGFLFPTGD
jgi:Cdc6-like AAA superfamily ATPase